MAGSVILCAAVLATDPGGLQQTPDGLYLKFAGSFVMQQDAELLSVGGVPLSATMDFDVGYGVQGGVGYTFVWESGPSVSLEFEYSFRTDGQPRRQRRGQALTLLQGHRPPLR